MLLSWFQMNNPSETKKSWKFRLREGNGVGGRVEVKHVANTGLNLPDRRAMAVCDVGRMSFKRKQTSGDTIWEIEFGFICFACKMRLREKQRHYP